MLVAAIHQFFAYHGVDPCHVVVAASGGVDSTALLLAMSDLRSEGFTITCAHVNHHLRGAESDADEEFVRQLADRHGISFRAEPGPLDTALVKRAGVEAAARDARLQHLQAIRSALGAQYIATAHQKNDQAETVLMRLFTGGGLGALRGIRPLREDGIIRPFLGVTRHEIEAFLGQRGVVPRFDRMNADPRFLRNRVREMLKHFDPSAIESLAAIAEQMRLLWPAIERMIDEADRSSTESSEIETRFLRWPDDLWLRQALLHRHVRRLDPHARDLSADDLLRIASAVESVKRLSITKRLELIRRGDSIVLRRPPEPAREFEVAVAPGSPAFIPEISASIAVALARSAADLASPDRLRQVIELPPGGVARFIVRSRRDGDRFQPLGMSQPKKLKDFLIDRKIAAEDRDRIPLLIWNGEIVWVAGVEVSDRFKVTNPAGELYEVRVNRVAASGEEDQDQANLHR